MSNEKKTIPFYKTVTGSILIMAGICAVLYWIFFASLGWITGHGKEMGVPKLEGKSLSEAMKILSSEGFDVDIDSTYLPGEEALRVISQQPEGGTTVKHGRTIFLIVNRQAPPQTPMPNLVNLSFRSAELLLKSCKLLLGDTVMKPDMARGAVLAQLVDGNEIAPGTMIPQGTKVQLVVGDGLGNKMINVPDLKGMTYPEAIAILSGSNLGYTVVFDGYITDTLNAVIYQQIPDAFDEEGNPAKINEGDNIDLRVKQGD